MPRDLVTPNFCDSLKQTEKAMFTLYHDEEYN